MKEVFQLHLQLRSGSMSALTTAPYRIENCDDVASPALVVYRELVEANIDQMIRIAGEAERLRPHCKTHKMAAVTRIQLDKGIRKHKCATIAEAEMLADVGVRDIFLAYNLVGPNIARVVRLREKFPDLQLLVTADDAGPVDDLAAAMVAAGDEIGVLLDVDTGMHRTGVDPRGPEAVALYRRIARSPGVRPAGLHVYDGQNHQREVAARTAAVDAVYRQAGELRQRLLAEDLPVPRMVVGGTGSFPIFARYDDPSLELSPGTIVFHDAGYGRAFPDLPFTPASALLTRVISRPGRDLLTLDLGNKAVAADPPAGHRLSFPDLPDAEELLHNEEHLVLRTPQADGYRPGDVLLALPVHACPTSALHRQAFVVVEGRVQQRWDVTARDRWLTI